MSDVINLGHRGFADVGTNKCRTWISVGKLGSGRLAWLGDELFNGVMCYLQVNLQKPCPFWEDNSHCAMRDCAVQPCPSVSTKPILLNLFYLFNFCTPRGNSRQVTESCYFSYSKTGALMDLSLLQQHWWP